MKHLFIVRPGDFDEQARRLSDAGMGQMQRLGTSIIDIIGNGTVRIIASDDADCYQSLKRLAGGLKPVDVSEVLPYFRNFDHERFPRTYATAMDIIDTRKDLSDVIIIISNDGIIKALVPYALNKYLDKVGIDGNYRPGTGMHIDLEKRAYQVIPKREW